MKSPRLFMGLCVSILFLVAASPALAQRAFVSAKTGSDSNPCSLASPCRSFGTAIAAILAGGEVIVLDSGGYGPVTVNKSITISSPAGIYAGISVTSGDGITVAAGSTDVVILRGLTINGAGGSRGIAVTSVGVLHVESCVINGSGGDGIDFNTPSALYLKDSIVRNGFQHGLEVHASSGNAIASVDHCRFEVNGPGPGYAGVVANSLGKITVSNSTADGNGYGFVAQAGISNPAELNLESSVAINNASGGLASFGNGATLRASNAVVTLNVTGLIPSSGSLLSRGNNTAEGNGTNGTFSGPYSAK